MENFGGPALDIVAEFSRVFFEDIDDLLGVDFWLAAFSRFVVESIEAIFVESFYPSADGVS